MLDSPLLVFGTLLCILIAGAAAGPIAAMFNVWRDPSRPGDKDPFSSRGKYEGVATVQGCLILIGILGGVAYTVYLIFF